MEDQPGQVVERAGFSAAELVDAQYMKAGIDGAGSRRKRRDIGLVALAQRGDVAVQAHLVGSRLGAEHHQVAGQAAPGPQAQRLGQRTQQAQVLHPINPHQNDGTVARDAEATQQATVANTGRLRRERTGLRARQAQHHGRGQGLDQREVVGRDAEGVEANPAQRG